MAENAFKADWPSFALGYSAGKKKGGGMKGFHKVQFFNDDRTTLLYTVFVPTGSNAIYAGEWPKSANGVAAFRGFAPSGENVTSDLDCYAVYDSITTLEETSWANISAISESGQAQNYFAVGDEKTIIKESTVGTVKIGKNLKAYIIGFDHNEELEGKGIHFGTFKDDNGVDVCFTDVYYNKDVSLGHKYFNMNHFKLGDYAFTYGGWSGCDFRYDILGSTDIPPSEYGGAPSEGRRGYDPSPKCTSNPVVGTVMELLPADLRSVMKPMIKYTDNVGKASSSEEAITATVDYLPLLSPFEVFGSTGQGNSHEQYKQKRYQYFSSGRSQLKYQYSLVTEKARWWLRSPSANMPTGFTYVGGTGGQNNSQNTSTTSEGVAPIFKV